MESLHVTLQDTYETDFRTWLLNEILNCAWFTHRQALNIVSAVLFQTLKYQQKIIMSTLYTK